MDNRKLLFCGLILFAVLCTWLPTSAFAQTNATRKSIFLTDSEKVRLINASPLSPTAELLSAMQARVEKRVLSPGLAGPSATNEWWHLAGEYLTDAALIHAVKRSPAVGAWLRTAVMDIVRRPVSDWSGPPFRGYGGGEMVGALETGHLSWGVAIAYDLAYDLFTQPEQDEILTALRDKGLMPCRRFLERAGTCMNWNCVLFAGFAVSASVLNDENALAYAAQWLPVAADHFQKDGSYGESLQYGNYAAYSLMLAHEALIRHSPAPPTTYQPYSRFVNWASYALFYRKPLSGWPLMDWPRSANFGDAAAIFRPSGDLLVHIAARARKELPQEAGLASWLFNTLYFPANEPGPHDLASFGMVNGFGFLSVIMLADAAPAISPNNAKLPVTEAFLGGDAFARDDWDGNTVLAARIPAAPRHASAHLHGDINSFILVHNKERLLLDPGHSCYRNITHEVEISSSTHNTCTFEVPGTAATPARNLVQRGGKRRPLLHENGLRCGDPVDDGGGRLIASHVGQVSVIGSDAAQLYGAPLRTFSRFWVLCGSNALFVIDKIEADVPVRTTWNWLLNNRDGLLDYKQERPGKITARRGNAGVKINHYGSGNMGVPIYALVHDAYHPLPAQLGEGVSGSGILMRWTEKVPLASQTVVHTMAIDNHAATPAWESTSVDNIYTLQSTARGQKWELRITGDGAFIINDAISGNTYLVSANSEGVWTLTSGKK